jgi:polyphosphate glucokinase
VKNSLKPGTTSRSKDKSIGQETQQRISSFSFHTSSAPPAKGKPPSQILVIDVGGSHVKILSTREKISRRFVSGPKMTAQQMVAGVLKLAKGWKYDGISIGYPGAVLRGKPVTEPYELGGGWVGFDFNKAFGCPVRLINDAAMQAMGSYEGGKMLFLGLGTGLGSTMIADCFVEPMELGHLPYEKKTYEDYLGKRGMKRLGKKQWRKAVDTIVPQLIKALEPDYVVIGGGNADKLKTLPAKCRLGANSNAFKGGFRLWADASA